MLNNTVMPNVWLYLGLKVVAFVLQLVVAKRLNLERSINHWQQKTLIYDDSVSRHFDFFVFMARIPSSALWFKDGYTAGLFIT